MLVDAIMKSIKKFIPLSIALSVLCLNIIIASAQSPAKDLGSYLLYIFTNPATLVTFVVEFLLGLGLGYFSLKALKYILALIAIIVLGILLNIWQSAQLMQFILEQMNIDWPQLLHIILFFSYTLGLTTILPLTLGIILGLVLAAIG